MIDSLFTLLYEWMSGGVWIALVASFVWGILSIILSPCHLSSIPLIIGYISSQGKLSVKKTFLISLTFAFGILLTIAIIGIVTASIGRLMGDVGSVGNYFVAAIFLGVGLYLLEIFDFNLNTFGLRQPKTGGLLAAFVLGLLFGIALGPCTFAYMAPVLGIVFQTAQTNYPLAVCYLFAFGLGHCFVIAGAGMLTGKVQKYLDWSDGSRVVLWIKKVCGILVLLGGVYLIYTTF